MAPQTKYHKLEGKHVLVIGGSSGIGKAVAEAAVESGASVTVSSSRQPKIDATVDGLKADYPGSKVAGIAADLSSKDTVEDQLENLFVQAARAHGQPVNHVVFTAADGLRTGPPSAMDADTILAAAQLRLVAPLLVGKVAERHLAKSVESSLTLTTGTTADKPDAGWSLVTFLAAGLQGLTRALAVDLAPIRVNCVRPGYVDTELWDAGMPREAKEAFFKKAGAKLLTGSVGNVEDVAEAYLWVLKDRNATGTIAGSDSGAFLVQGIL